MRLAPLSSAAIGCLLASSICVAQTSPVIAKSGDVELASADVKAIVATLPVNARSAVSTDLPALEGVVRNELTRRAVLADLKSKGFDRDAKTLSQLDRIRDEALLRLWLSSRAEVPADYPSDAEVKTAFEANKSSLAKPAEYHLAQIYISAPDGGDATAIATALRKANDVAGKLATSDFAKLARENSEHAASATQGGDLGFVTQNRMLPEVAGALRGKKAGDVVGPVKTAQGLHFVKLLEVKTPPAPTLEEARPTLVTLMRSQRQKQLETEYLAQLNGKVGVTINQIELAKLQQSLK